MGGFTGGGEIHKASDRRGGTGFLRAWFERQIEKGIDTTKSKI
jgi:hypothetical protein